MHNTNDKQMMRTRNRLDACFSQLYERGKKALAAFLMGGDPDISTSGELLKAALKGGADILEIGVPFSDPLADGPVIQESAGRALKNKTSLDDILILAQQTRMETNAPIVLLSYWNPIYQYGPGAFFRRAVKCGVDGVVIPDLPFEEKRPFYQAAEKNGLLLIDFLTPLTREERAGKLVKNARGFIYCITVTGITGVRDTLSSNLARMAEIARMHTDLPLLAGFGISSPAQACEASQWVDGVIVGSALVHEIEKHLERPEVLPEIIQSKVYAFRKGLDESFPLDAGRGSV